MFMWRAWGRADLRVDGARRTADDVEAVRREGKHSELEAETRMAFLSPWL